MKINQVQFYFITTVMVILSVWNLNAFKLDLSKFTDELKLTEDQLTKLAQVQSEAQKKTIRLKADVQVAHLELRDLLLDESSTDQTVNEKADQLNKLRAQLQRVHLDAMLTIRKLLTPEQRKGLSKLLRDKKTGMAGMGKLHRKFIRHGKQMGKMMPHCPFHSGHKGPPDIDDDAPVEMHK